MVHRGEAAIENGEDFLALYTVAVAHSHSHEDLVRQETRCCQSTSWERAPPHWALFGLVSIQRVVNLTFTAPGLPIPIVLIVLNGGLLASPQSQGPSPTSAFLPV